MRFNVVSLIKSRVAKSLEKEEALVYFSVVVYGVVFSYLTIMRMYALGADAWDLGNYNQAMYTFVCCGKPFVWTADVLNNPSGSLFGIHFSPIFFLFIPAYIVFPHPQTLLVLQAFGIGLGAVPLYRIAKKRLLSKDWAVLLAIVYLLNPLLIGVNWFDFHPEAFIPTAILFVIYYFLERRWLPFALSSLLTLSIIETIAIPLALLAVYFVYRTFRDPMRPRDKRPLVASLLAIACIVWLVLAFRVISIFNPTNPLYFGGETFFSILGAKSIGDLPIVVILHPENVINAFSFDLEKKASFLLVAFGSMGFLSLLSPVSLLPSLAWLGPSLLGNYQPYYQIGVTYPAFILPFFALGTIEGLKNIRGWNVKVSQLKHQKFLIILFPLIFLILSNPILSMNYDSVTWTDYGNGIPEVSVHSLSAEKLSSLIPSTASVLVDDHIFPLVSSRPNAYTIPWAIDNNTGPFFTYVYELVNKVDYILLDLSNGEVGRTESILAMSTDFGVLGYSNNVLLLERGYQGSPLVFDPLNETFNHQELTLHDGFSVKDPGSVSGTVFEDSGTKNTDFWYGPYVQLPPGEYRVTFWLKIGDPCSGSLLNLRTSAFDYAVQAVAPSQPEFSSDITVTTSNTNNKTIFSNILVTCDMLNTQSYQPITTTIALDEFGAYEFAGLNVSSNVPIFLDRINLIEVKPFSYVQPFPIQANDFPPIVYSPNQVSTVLNISKLIPAGKAVLIQSSLSTLIHDTPSVYWTPDSELTQNVSLYQSSINSVASRVPFIMFDSSYNDIVARSIAADSLISRDFGILAWSNNVVLLEKNYSGNPVIFTPYSKTVASDQLVLRSGSQLITDPSSPNGLALEHNASTGDFWWGPYVALIPGEYDVTYSLKSIHPILGPMMKLEVNYFDSEGNKSTITSMIVFGNNLSSIGSYTNVTLYFTALYPGNYEFPGLMVMTNSSIYIDQIQIQMLRPIFPSSSLPD